MLTTYHHRIFDAMPVGRPLTARDAFNRTQLPPGWNIRDVTAALMALAKTGGVTIEKQAKCPLFYSRIENRPNGEGHA